VYQPDTTYDTVQDKVDIRDFHAYQARFVVRPPYQRKSVWSTKKQQALMDSLFRRKTGRGRVHRLIWPPPAPTGTSNLFLASARTRTGWKVPSILARSRGVPRGNSRVSVPRKATPGILR